METPVSQYSVLNRSPICYVYFVQPLNRRSMLASGVSSSTHTTQCVHIEILINHFWTFTPNAAYVRLDNQWLIQRNTHNANGIHWNIDFLMLTPTLVCTLPWLRLPLIKSGQFSGATTRRLSWVFLGNENAEWQN